MSDEKRVYKLLITKGIDPDDQYGRFEGRCHRIPDRHGYSVRATAARVHRAAHAFLLKEVVSIWPI